MTISFDMSSHDVLILDVMRDRPGFLRFPPAVNSLSSDFIQEVIHFSLTLSLKGLFKTTSSGWRIEVSPPGITAWNVFRLFTLAFTMSVRCERNWSHTSMDFFFSSAPGLVAQTLFNHKITPFSSIHPLGWQWITTPGGNFSPLEWSFVWKSPWI